MIESPTEVLPPIGPSVGVVARTIFNRSAAWLTSLERRGIIRPAPRDVLGRRCYPPAYIEEIKAALYGRPRRGGPEAA
jgi:hypothetical protein